MKTGNIQRLIWNFWVLTPLVLSACLGVHAGATDGTSPCGYVGLRPLSGYAQDLNPNHGGPWADLPTLEEQKRNGSFVTEHLDDVKEWLDGDSKIRRIFFEYFGGLRETRKDPDAEKSVLVKLDPETGITGWRCRAHPDLSANRMACARPIFSRGQGSMFK